MKRRYVPYLLSSDEHVLEKVNETISKEHGQPIETYRCLICGARVKRYSPQLKSTTGLIEKRKVKCHK